MWRTIHTGVTLPPRVFSYPSSSFSSHLRLHHFHFSPYPNKGNLPLLLSSCPGQRKQFSWGRSPLPPARRPPSDPFYPFHPSEQSPKAVSTQLWNTSTFLDGGPIPERWYRHHHSTILLPQFGGGVAWATLVGLSLLNLGVFW